MVKNTYGTGRSIRAASYDAGKEQRFSARCAAGYERRRGNTMEEDLMKTSKISWKEQQKMKRTQTTNKKSQERKVQERKIRITFPG